MRRRLARAQDARIVYHGIRNDDDDDGGDDDGSAFEESVAAYTRVRKGSAWRWGGDKKKNCN